MHSRASISYISIINWYYFILTLGNNLRRGAQGSKISLNLPLLKGEVVLTPGFSPLLWIPAGVYLDFIGAGMTTGDEKMI
jgi:hypothetical protein